MCTFRETEFEWMLALDWKLITFLDLATLKTIGQVAKRGRSSEFSSGRADLGFTHPAQIKCGRKVSIEHQVQRGAVLHFCSSAFLQFRIFAFLQFCILQKNKSGERIRAALHLMIQHRHPLHHRWWLSLLKYEQPSLKLKSKLSIWFIQYKINRYQNNLESAFHYLGITNQF